MPSQVSVFVGGVQKSGTRSISSFFRRHPNLAVHNKPEGHFFDRDKNFINDIPISKELNEYLAGFEVGPKTHTLCDISPDYIFRQNTVKRVFNYNPNAQWLILLRNPIERAYSAWNMEVNRNTETLSFESALISEITGANQDDRLHDRFQYIGRSQYYKQLLNLWRYFPKKQCHVYPAESVWTRPQSTLNDILKSLNINSNNDAIYEHIHKGEYALNLSNKARKLLIKILSIELYKLPEILNWKENPWDKEN